MNIFTIISHCDPDRLSAALTEDKNIISQRSMDATPYLFATNMLSRLKKSYLDEQEMPVKNTKKIDLLASKISGLKQVVVILRDVTLQEAIDNQDIVALAEMAEIDGMIRSDFETGEHKGKSPMQYAREQRKTDVIAWFNQRSERVMEYFTACPGTLFDARVRALEHQRAQETRAEAQKAHSGLMDIAKAAGADSTSPRL